MSINQVLSVSNYSPACPQYSQNSGAIVKINDQISVGNCSANNISGNPSQGPYDFACIQAFDPNSGTSSQKCINLQSGQMATSPNGICCFSQPQYSVPTTIIYPSQPSWPIIPFQPRAQHCQAGSVNACALVLDRQQGLPTTNSAGHFNNMKRCQAECGYPSSGLL
jgi:hypothetical protein